MTEQLYHRWTREELDRLENIGLRRTRRMVIPDCESGGWCEIDGRRVLNFASNDYLNLAGDSRVVAAARVVLETRGVGARASALVSGRTDWHEFLEQRLATFEKRESAVLFPSGYAANVGTVAALVGPQDAVFCERLNHASLVDGCRLSGARFRVFRHHQLDRLERELSQANGYRRRLIVTDSVFSMDGTLAPLQELCQLSERYDAALLVDEAHATGIFGEHGRGLVEELHLEQQPIVRVGTLSKALGTLGGFVADSQQFCDWLWNRARTQIFSTALPPALCAAAVAAIDIVTTEPQRRHALREQSRRFRSQATARGFRIVPGGEGPIIPIVIGDPLQTVTLARALLEAGFLVAAIRPPTVPQETSRLRITLTSAHEDQDLERLLNALERLSS